MAHPYTRHHAEVFFTSLALVVLAICFLPLFPAARRQTGCLTNQQWMAMAPALPGGTPALSHRVDGSADAGRPIFCRMVHNRDGAHSSHYLFLNGRPRINYGMNGWLAGRKVMRDLAVETTILTADGGNEQHLLPYARFINTTRHHGKFIASFVDGHVAVIDAKDLGRVDELLEYKDPAKAKGGKAH